MLIIHIISLVTIIMVIDNYIIRIHLYNQWKLYVNDTGFGKEVLAISIEKIWQQIMGKIA